MLATKNNFLSESEEKFRFTRGAVLYTFVFFLANNFLFYNLYTTITHVYIHVLVFILINATIIHTPCTLIDTYISSFEEKMRTFHVSPKDGYT